MSVTVDRTEITAIKSQYEDEIELWKKKVFLNNIFGKILYTVKSRAIN